MCTSCESRRLSEPESSMFHEDLSETDKITEALFYSKPVKTPHNEFESGAQKEISNKPRMDLIAPEMLDALASGLTYGATKYSARNWEKGIPYMASYAAALRHLLKWAKGIDKDDESGLNHIDQAMLNLGMIATQIRRKREDLDDRPSVDKTTNKA